MYRVIWCFVFFCFVVAFPFMSSAAPHSIVENSEEYTNPLIVGVKSAPPFAFKDEADQWTGISIRLFKDIAEDLNRQLLFREYTLEDLLTAVENGEIDVAVSALSITPERELRMDFSHPFFTSHLGIAIPAKQDTSFFSLFSNFFSWQIMGYLAGLLGLLLCVGFLAWLIERRANPEQFRGGKFGLFDGLWWAAVTMTTVGYGDLSPKSPAGRMLALAWMFVSVGLMSFFIAGITTTLTLKHIQGTVHGPEDLVRARTAAVAGASSVVYLKHIFVSPILFSDLDQALDALSEGRVQAVVHDKPLLQYAIHSKHDGKITVLNSAFDPQLYGFAFKRESPLRKPVNISLLSKIEDRDYWHQLVGPYLGTN
ncbi:transporter substrate-binding domain-containing protein [Desulfovibrio inopinatus]|uniref:transporter substrate-binding domain-containing protein n=1 Tax=Desulfovibrio inopinatus TaxID=102109 RepID=UPI00042056BC|nr:transporter substrate-binding domain-containing protein [Desulfovibrio inopinatus]